MKYIITCKFPSGAVWAWTRVKGRFALAPLKNGFVHGAFAWETRDEAEDYLLAQMEAAPDLRKLGPFKIEAMDAP